MRVVLRHLYPDDISNFLDDFGGDDEFARCAGIPISRLRALKECPSTEFLRLLWVMSSEAQTIASFEFQRERRSLQILVEALRDRVRVLEVEISRDMKGASNDRMFQCG